MLAKCLKVFLNISRCYMVWLRTSICQVRSWSRDTCSTYFSSSKYFTTSTSASTSRQWLRNADRTASKMSTVGAQQHTARIASEICFSCGRLLVAVGSSVGAALHFRGSCIPNRANMCVLSPQGRAPLKTSARAFSLASEKSLFIATTFCKTCC